MFRPDRREWLALLAAGLVAPRLTWADTKEPTEPKGKIFFLNLEDGPIGGIFSFYIVAGTWERLNDSGPGIMTRARISPDGKKLAYSKTTQNGNQLTGGGIWIIDLTREVMPKQISDVNGRVAWSADGKSLLASGPIDINSNVFETWRIELASGEKTRLPIPDTEIVVDCSPDGQRLLSYKGENFLTRKADGTDPNELGTSNSFINYRFSADSQQVFYTELTGMQNNIRKIYAQSLSGGKPVQIVGSTIRTVVKFFCNSPDGKWLAIGTEKRGMDNDGVGQQPPMVLELVTTDGKTTRDLMLPHGQVFPLDWRE